MTPSWHQDRDRDREDARLRAAAPFHGPPTMSDRRRILVCDAESQTLHALRVVLRGAGFEVDATRNAAQALDRGALRLPTAAIIELVLPDGDGVALCRRLREWSAMPVILLSAVGDEDAQVRAFEAGADDYVTKPFRPRELVARLLAHLRRAEPGADQPCVDLDGLEIDLAARAVRRDGQVVHLTPIEFTLLGVLIQNRGRLLTHHALLQQVWGAAYTDGKQTLRAHIANLRRKIEPTDGARLIQTDHGVGYRLADVHPASARQSRPEEEVIDRKVVRSGVSACTRPETSVGPRPARGPALDTPYGRCMTRSPPDSARQSWPTEEEPARINRGGSPRLAPRMAAHCAGSFEPYLKGYSDTIGRHRPGATQPGERSYLDE